MCSFIDINRLRGGMVDTPVLGTGAERRVGSNPTGGSAV